MLSVLDQVFEEHKQDTLQMAAVNLECYHNQKIHRFMLENLACLSGVEVMEELLFQSDTQGMFKTLQGQETMQELCEYLKCVPLSGVQTRYAFTLLLRPRRCDRSETLRKELYLTPLVKDDE